MFNASLQFLRTFSVSSRVADPEGIAFSTANRHLYLVSTPDVKVFEYGTDGTYYNEHSIAGFQPTPLPPQGLAFAPTSNPNDNPAELALYIVDGGIDNAADGRIYEAVLVNQAPQVNAGSDQIILQGASALLNATVADDGLPYVPGTSTLSWQAVAGPGTVTFTSPTTAATSASFSQPGAYTLRFTANDGALSSFDDVIVQVVSSLSRLNRCTSPWT